MLPCVNLEIETARRHEMKFEKLKLTHWVVGISTILMIHLPGVLMAQSMTGTVKDAVEKMSNLLLLIMVGAAAWAGFELKGGNPQAVQKLLYCIAGVIIVGSAQALVNFFKV